MNSIFVLMRPLLFLFLCAISLQAGENVFPRLDDAKRIKGELVAADFVRRSGEIRAEDGSLVRFSMPPYAIVKLRGAEADLREVPLGTKLDFLLLPDADGRHTRLLTTDDGQVTDPEQQKKFGEFTERRGVAGWIESTEGKIVDLTLFSGDPVAFETAWGELLVKGKTTKLCVANDELRTWNPGVDGENGSIQEVERIAPDGFGNSGYRIRVSVSNQLEGFRPGRVARVFLQGWKVRDQLYGESLMGYGFGRMLNQELVENVAKEYPDQFPFRTDFGNAHLPWFALKEGVKPPPFSEHLVFGQLVEMDADTGTGRFLSEDIGETVTFSLVKEHQIKLAGESTQFAKLPLGQRYRFSLYQDDKGAFTRVTQISDDVSHQKANATTARLVEIHPNSLHVAWQLPEVKNYNNDMETPPDFGHRIVRVTDKTRVWKGETALSLKDLEPGEAVLFNSTAELPGEPGSATDLWVQIPEAEAVPKK